MYGLDRGWEAATFGEDRLLRYRTEAQHAQLTGRARRHVMASILRGLARRLEPRLTPSFG